MFISVGLMLASMVFLGMWVYKDAKQRGLSAGLWTLLVIVSGNLIGLILYLIVGRKQTRKQCANCGAFNDAHSRFCPNCGSQVNPVTVMVKPNRGLLAGCIISILLAFGCLGIMLVSVFSADGFTLNRSMSYYSGNLSGSAQYVAEVSSGDTWRLSYNEATKGYECKKTFNATKKPVSVTVEAIECDGTVKLRITQGNEILEETIEQGKQTFSLTRFNKGKLKFSIINVSASNFDGVITVESGE